MKSFDLNTLQYCGDSRGKLPSRHCYTCLWFGTEDVHTDLGVNFLSGEELEEPAKGARKEESESSSLEIRLDP